jgi:DNA-binding transcriptional ArsR family regulator
MQGDEIREQIEALRQEVRGLSKSILNLRQEDMRKVFGDQIRPVLLERIRRHQDRLNEPESQDAPGLSSVEIVDRAISTFQQEGKDRALEMLDEVGKGIDAEDTSEGRFRAELVGQLRDYFSLSDTIFDQTMPGVPSGRSVRIGSGPWSISPETFERQLAPLSNTKRVQVLLVLYRENCSLAELCRELDLQKGHLQFHLKALMDVEYIRFDKKSRLYSITDSGTHVMEGVAQLIKSMPRG